MPCPLQVLLEPTIIYVPKVVALHEQVGLKGVVHITGGGMPENIPRVIPKGLGVDVKADAYQVRWWPAAVVVLCGCSLCVAVSWVVAWVVGWLRLRQRGSGKLWACLVL